MGRIVLFPDKEEIALIAKVEVTGDAAARIGDKPLDRGKVLTAEDLDRLGGFARYKDVDGDGVGH